MKNHSKRTAVQILAAILQNGNLKGLFSGRIFTGNAKQICVPGLNCYSCPGALFACPVGALQNALTSMKPGFPYYVLGVLILFGALFGRFVCGFLCPFGLLQDLLYKIPLVKKISRFPGDKKLRYLKYVILLLMVVVLPAAIKLTPVFCKYLCPSGTLSGIVLMSGNTALFSQIGKIFTWKVIVLAAIVILSIMLYRPFCKYLCPLGAFYGLFNKVGIVKLHLDADACVSCGSCASYCKMGVNPSKNPDSSECIRCMECINVCEPGALYFHVKSGSKFK